MEHFQYTIREEEGIHARPAGMLVREVKKYKSKIIFRANQKETEGLDLLGIMKMAVKCGQTLTVEVSGEDEKTAVEGLKLFFENYL